jgi:predicted transcriptional regulator
MQYELQNTDKRKAQIIATLGSPPGADQVCPPQQRLIIADLVIEGVEKVFAAMQAHSKVAAHVMNEAQHAVFEVTMLMEVGRAVEGYVIQHARQNFLDIMSDPRSIGDLTAEAAKRGLNLEDVLKRLGLE